MKTEERKTMGDAGSGGDEKTLHDFMREAAAGAAKDDLIGTLLAPLEEDEWSRLRAIEDPNERAVALLRTVQDPEMHVNIYDLGLVYTIDISEEKIYVEMTLTAPCCPVADMLPETAKRRLAEGFPRHASVEVKVVWQPAWTKDRMSEEAKLILNMW